MRENTELIIIDFTKNTFNIKPQKSIKRGTGHVELGGIVIK